MIFRQIFDRESCTFTYLLGDEATREAALVDTVLEHVERDLELVGELGLRLVHVLETHVHADHVTGAGEIRKKTGARTHVAREGGAPCADDSFVEGNRIVMGALCLEAIATPGHTSGCMSYIISEGGGVDRVLTGDALLIRGCGRTDFQGGDAHVLFRSVSDKLFSLGDGVLVYPGHDYRGMTVSTIGEEKRHNPRLAVGVTAEQFVAKMAALNLPPPAKIDIAVPANRACGDVSTVIRQG
jgi:glyoxylase-like metal-dependent hydrolase (beta-lactamase superfamily II)